jgi:hypothetical protein
MDTAPPPAPRPSTLPGVLAAPPRPPEWITPLAIVCIIFGAGGVLQGLASILTPWIVGLLKPFASQVPTTQALEGRVPTLVAVGLLTAAVAAILLTAGILLARRRPTAVRTLRAWAVLKLLLSAVTLAVNAVIQRDQLAAMQSARPGGTPMPPGMAPFMNATLYVGLAIAALWLAALPVFILVWFSRPRPKADLAAWFAGAGLTHATAAPPPAPAR